MGQVVSRRQRRHEGPDHVESWYFYVVCSHGVGKPVTRFPRWVLNPERLTGERHYDDANESAIGLQLDTLGPHKGEEHDGRGVGVKPARWRCSICRTDVTLTWPQLDDLVAKAYAADVSAMELRPLAASLSNSSRADGTSSVNN